MNTASPTIADIEKQIARVNAALDKARAQRLVNAEKALVTAQKAAAAAQSKIDLLNTKSITTPAAKTRLANAQATLATHTDAVTSAKDALKKLLKEQKKTAKIAKKVKKIIAKDADSKLSKSERKALKKANKKAKKNAAAETVTDATTSTVSTTPKRPARKAPAKRRVVVEPESAPATISLPDVNPVQENTVNTETSVEAVIDVNELAISPAEKRESIES